MSRDKTCNSIMGSIDGAINASIDCPRMVRDGFDIYDMPEYDVISEAVMALVKRLASEGLIDDV